MPLLVPRLEGAQELFSCPQSKRKNDQWTDAGLMLMQGASALSQLRPQLCLCYNFRVKPGYRYRERRVTLRRHERETNTAEGTIN